MDYKVRVIAIREGLLSLRAECEPPNVARIVLQDWTTGDLVKEFLPVVSPSKWDRIREDPFTY